MAVGFTHQQPLHRHVTIVAVTLMTGLFVQGQVCSPEGYQHKVQLKDITA